MESLHVVSHPTTFQNRIFSHYGVWIQGALKTMEKHSNQYFVTLADNAVPLGDRLGLARPSSSRLRYSITNGFN